MVPDGAVKLKKQETASIKELNKDTGRSEQTTIKCSKRKMQNELHRKVAVRTHTAGFVARPLVIVLTSDSSLSH